MWDRASNEEQQIEENRLNERMIRMKTSTFTEEQIVQILREAERGKQTIGSVYRTHGVSENTFPKWRKKYSGVDVAAYHGDSPCVASPI